MSMITTGVTKYKEQMDIPRSLLKLYSPTGPECICICEGGIKSLFQHLGHNGVISAQERRASVVCNVQLHRRFITDIPCFLLQKRLNF